MKMLPSKVLLPIAISFLLLQNANATLYFTDHFAYTDGANLGATSGGGGTNWTLASGDVSQIKVTTASTQTSPSGYAPAAGLGVAVTPTGSRKQTGVPFNGATGIPVADGNVVYASFLLNVRTLPSANMRIAYMHNGASTQGGIEVVVSSTGQVGIQKKGSGTTFVSGTPVASNGTHLVVMRYTFQSGNDEVAVWVDPDSNSYGVNPAPTTGLYAHTTGGGSDMSNAIQHFCIESAAVTGPVFWIDEVNVGTTWADVTPSGAPVPPSISSGPTNQDVHAGETATFSVSAAGSTPLQYQWYFNTNSVLNLATNSTLVITNAQLSDAGEYSVLVSNAYGSVTSAVAQLTVTTFPPSVESDPVDQSVFVGQDATFNVQASGTTPLSYQWYYNTNSVIANATNSSLTVTNAQLTDAGGYSALVSNDFGSVTSAVAQLTVNTPVAPSITSQPQDQLNVSPGGTAMFSVTVSGSEPLSYQWYYNNSTLLTGATDPTLTITNVQVSNAGTYSVVVNNVAGSATSSNAVLTVDNSPVAPSFVTQPASQIVLVGGTANFSATAAGTAPIFYQWKKDGVPVPGTTSTSLTLTNVQNSDSGSYSLVASNSVGTATSSNAVLTVTAAAPIVNSAYNLVGFGQATTGGGVIPTNDAAYVQAFTPLDLANAIRSANKTAGSVKVIEIMNDLDLGWNEVGSAVQTLDSTPFRSHATPKLHPRLLITGVSLIDIKSKSGLTIFSANGATIRHACFNVKGTSNIIIRNLKFDELWEWDEDSKGNYDGNDWDFIDLGNAGTVFNIWIDHCTFTKSYDGIVDVKQGSYDITFSWCKYTGDDGATNPNSFVWQQINKLESNKTSYAMYNALRNSSNGGLSTTDIVTIIQGHDKTHLVGANSLKAENATHTLTFHHQWFMNPWDRCVPRLRAGNVHDYNIYVDDTLGLAAKRLRDQHTFSSSYSFNPFLNGSISTEGGAILVEKSVYKDCLTPLRNNQTDPSNSVYTGKIKALDTIYQFDSTFVRGDSTDPGNPLGPKQAPIIPFSWNLPGNQLPYSYTMDDPAQLQAIVTSPTGGAGAGVLTWNKTNWMMTSYAPTAPVISADPQSQTVALSNNVTFTVLAYGSAVLRYQWYFNSSTPLSGATNSSFSIGSVQAGDVGTYSVIVSNTAGTATSASATLGITSSGTAPSAGFTATPINGVAPLAVTFTDISTGTPPLSLSWDLGDSTTNTAGGASFVHTYAAGTYTVTLTASNSVGTDTLVSNNLITATTPTPFESWQLHYFGCTGCPQAADTADPDGDGMNNQAEFLAGTDPTSSASALRIISAVQQGTDVVITWTTAGGSTNAVQTTAGGAGGSYTTNFVDLTTWPHIIITGSGDVTTNYTDVGGATNSAARYYRVRLVP